MSISDNHASRIVDVIDNRIDKTTFSNARVEKTWGVLSSIDSDGTASAYLYGGDTPSDGFRLNGFLPSVNDIVKVGIDKAKGDRWIDQVKGASAWPEIALDVNGGRLLFGQGTAAPAIPLTAGPDGELLILGQGIYGRYPALSTGPTYVNQWTKVASGTVANQYGDHSVQLLVHSFGPGATSEYCRGFVRFIVKQQLAFGGNPDVLLETLHSSNINFCIAVTQNTPTTKWELWAQPTKQYQTPIFVPTVVSYGTLEGVKWYTNSGYQVAKPTGTLVVDCVDAAPSLSAGLVSDVAAETSGATAVAGATGRYADAAHRHALPTLQALAPGAVGDIVDETSGCAAAAGATGKFADAAHRHALPAIPTAGLVADIAAETYKATAIAGATGRLADAGHRHAMPSAPDASVVAMTGSAAVTLTTTAQDLASCTKTFTPTVAEVALVIAVFDFAVDTGSSDVLQGLINVDGTASTIEAHFRLDSTVGRASVTTTTVVALTANVSHTIKLQAKKSGTVGSSKVWYAHTSLTVMRIVV